MNAVGVSTRGFCLEEGEACSLSIPRQSVTVGGHLRAGEKETPPVGEGANPELDFMRIVTTDTRSSKLFRAKSFMALRALPGTYRRSELRFPTAGYPPTRT